MGYCFTSAYGVLSDIGHRTSTRVGKSISYINIMQVEHSYIFNSIYVITTQNQASRNISVHQAYPNRQNPTAGRVQGPSGMQIRFGKVFSALLHKCRNDGHDSSGRCMLGSVVCCPGIGIPCFWHLVVLD